MGLDCSHGVWHGAYSAFGRWRQKMAEVAGYQVEDCVGEDGFKWPTVMVDWGHLDPDTLYGEWKKPPEDALMYLIVHSDCEGVLHPDASARLADRLEELVPLLPEEQDRGHIGSWKKKTQTFITGLRQAAKAGEDVTFG